MLEAAKQIKDAPDYWVFPDSKVWSTKSSKFLKPQRGGFKGKYRKYTLWVNGVSSQKYCHALVMEYFGEEKPTPNHEINHINGDTTDNKLENLEWVTSSENTRHGVVNGLFSRVKLTKEQVKEIKKIFKEEEDYFDKVPDVARKYGVTNCVIMAIKHNKNWKYIE